MVVPDAHVITLNLNLSPDPTSTKAVNTFAATWLEKDTPSSLDSLVREVEFAYSVYDELCALSSQV